MLLEFLQAITGVFVVVYDGQHGLRFTLGRAGKIVGPGVHFKMPIIQLFRIEETKHTTLDLQPQVIQLSDDLVYEVDCKVVYQIVNLRKATINIDELVTGLQNRVVIAVQRVLRSKDRESIKKTEQLCDEIIENLSPVEDQWGVRILQFGFSNISPSPATLEITQLELLAREKLSLYQLLRSGALSEEAAVALISGAVVSVRPDDGRASSLERRRRDETAAEELEQTIVDDEEQRAGRKVESEAKEPDPLGEDSGDEAEA